MAKPDSKEPVKSTRKAAVREQRKRREQRDRFLVIGGVAVFAILIAVLLIVPNLPVNSENIQKPENITRSSVNEMTAGDPNAPVKVENFSDFKCSHCADFATDAEKALIKDYIETGKVYFEYVPFSFLSPESYSAAEASYCAMDQGKFWEYHDTIYANFGAELSNGMLRGIAQQLKLNMSDFDSCYNSGKYRQQVLDDFSYGQQKGVNATPTFEVNGKLVDRYSLFDEIDAALQQ